MTERRRGGFRPRRLVLLEKVGAEFYVFLFRHAQGAGEDARRRLVQAARAYLRAGGTPKGLRSSMEHVLQTAGPVLEAWYDESPGQLRPLVDELLGALSTSTPRAGTL